MQPNTLNPDRVVTKLAPEVTLENIDDFRKAARPKSKRRGEMPTHGYEGIKYIDHKSGKTYWRDGGVTQWTFDKTKDPDDPTPSTDREKWTALVESYWSTYPYRCSTCGMDGGQRPRNPNRGKIILYRLDRYVVQDGSERYEDLAPLCKTCHADTVDHALSTDTPWSTVVAPYPENSDPTRRLRPDEGMCSCTRAPAGW